MTITNHSAMPDQLAERIIKECISAYESLYGRPSAKVEIIVYSSGKELEAERARIQGDDSPGLPPAMLNTEWFNRALKGITELFMELLKMDRKE